MTYDNTNRGTLGKNKRREKDSHPEYSGKCDIDGQMYWISAWVKVGQGGEKFFSLSFKPQEAPRNPPAREPVNQTREQQRAHSQGFDSYDDDIPF